jgi:membrane-bound lytic murein transglycosylase D
MFKYLKCLSYSLSLLGILFLSGCSVTPQKTPSSTPEPSKTVTKIETPYLTPDTIDIDVIIDDAPIKISLLPNRPKAPLNLWQRINNGFSLLSSQPSKRFSGTLDTYLNQKYLNRLGKKARPYLHHIVEAIEQRGMPLEIALLPVVESGFEPTARSPYQAAGLWQFMPKTGKWLGLKQNWWYDGRQDVIASTDAALDYLQLLHKNLNGNWLLALAAYNCGEGTVRKAIRRNKAAGKPIDYWSLDLPKETKRYIPKLMAFSAIVQDPEKYGVNLPEIDNQPYLTVVNVGEQIDLSLAADLAKLSKQEFKRLNPGFKRWASSPKGPHSLVLPIDKAANFRYQLAQVAEKMPRPSPKAPKASRSRYDGTKKYKIRQGDTLSKVARLYGTNVKKLLRLNKKLGKRSTLRIGQRIVVPYSKSKSSKRQKKKIKNQDNIMLNQVTH